MKLSTHHLTETKAPLALLAATVLFGVASISWTRSELAKSGRALSAQEQQLRDARGRFQRSGDERDLIVRYTQPYEQLREQGLIGPEQRINWLDALRTANQQTRAFGAEYRVSTQQPYPYARELNAANLGMAQSVMKLSLQLAHAGELLRFLHQLEAQNAGVFDINQCVLERISSANAPLLAQPNVRAECELAWITLNPEPAERRP